MKAAHCSRQVRDQRALENGAVIDRSVALRSDRRTRPDSSSSGHTDPECRFSIWMAGHASKSPRSRCVLPTLSRNFFFLFLPASFCRASWGFMVSLCDTRAFLIQAAPFSRARGFLSGDTRNPDREREHGTWGMFSRERKVVASLWLLSDLFVFAFLCVHDIAVSGVKR